MVGGCENVLGFQGEGALTQLSARAAAAELITSVKKKKKDSIQVSVSSNIVYI